MSRPAERGQPTLQLRERFEAAANDRLVQACYGDLMARGWESKAIESQQEDARATTRIRPELTPEERARAERRATLALALAHAEAELQGACRPAHRDMLRLKLEALKAELGSL